MILSQISYLDCLVFVAVLAPQLLLHQPLETFNVLLRALPFFCIISMTLRRLRTLY